MKWLIPCFVFLFIFIPSAFGAGTITQTGPINTGVGISIITLSCTADSSDGSYPATNLTAIYGYIYQVVTDPGSTAPTDDYDITLVDTDGCDIMGGTLANRDTSNSEQAMPLVGEAYGPRFINGVLTCNISNNSVNSATITIKIYIVK